MIILIIITRAHWTQDKIHIQAKTPTENVKRNGQNKSGGTRTRGRCHAHAKVYPLSMVFLAEVWVELRRRRRKRVYGTYIAPVRYPG